MIEKILALATLFICIGMLVRLCLGGRRRRKLDDALRQTWASSRRLALAVWGWRSSRRRAAVAAQELIRRARAEAQRDGNVYRPGSFREPRKPH